MSASPSLRGLFVAGTDTGVGKTVASAGLLRWAADNAVAVAPYKPAESGCLSGRPADAHTLRAASRSTLPITRICPYRLKLPVAPAAAARAAGVRVTAPAILRHARALARGPGAPALLVESAGGLLSPYARNLTGADLAQRLGLPVLLVARNALGTINHTALAYAELRRRRLPVVAILLMTAAPSRSLRTQRNPELIAEATGVAPLVLPHFPNPDADHVAAYLTRSGLAARIFRAAGLLP